jgi:Zn-dependent metalloprotease
MVCSIASPDLLAHLGDSDDAEDRAAALRTIATSASLRTQRLIVGRLMRRLDVDAQTLGLLPEADVARRQSVYDVRNGGRFDLPGVLVRADGDEPSEDPAVNEAFDGTASTYDFFRTVFDRDSVDDQGLELVSSVHYGVRFENALWNGTQMIYGDGGGRLFLEGSLTRALDIMAHELTHGVTQYTADLEYRKQSGALNEHFSDVFGSLVKQWTLGQTAQQADWLIGAGVLVPRLGRALRSMADPGTAWEGDRQPGTMSGYIDLPDDNRPENDNGGVHINSGIPNRAFALAATRLGGHAWERAGRIWYLALTERLHATAQFADAAQATVAIAGELFPGEDVADVVEQAWRDVEVLA